MEHELIKMDGRIKKGEEANKRGARTKKAEIESGKTCMTAAEASVAQTSPTYSYSRYRDNMTMLTLREGEPWAVEDQ